MTVLHRTSFEDEDGSEETKVYVNYLPFLGKYCLEVKQESTHNESQDTYIHHAAIYVNPSELQNIINQLQEQLNANSGNLEPTN